MVNYRLIHVLEQDKLLSKYQAGFRRTFSTQDQLALLENKIQNGFFTRQHTTVIFFDIKQAYGRACWVVLR